MSEIDRSQGPRVLIVRVGAMGDVLHGMPAVAALRAAWPDAHIGWAVEPRWAPLLRAGSRADGSADRALVDCVHLANTGAWSQRPFSLATARSITALRRSLRAERYHISLDLQGSIRSAVIANLSGAARRIGSASPRERPARLLYTEQVALQTVHVVPQAAEMVSQAVGRQVFPASVSLPVDAVAETWCDALLHGNTRPLVFLAPTAGWGAKQWPAQRFGALAKQMSAEGFRILVNASPTSPDPVADAVIASSNHAAELVACTLPQMIALMRRVQLAVAGDSGPLHLAAALGVPVVALFGPTDPARNGPYGTRSVVLRDPASVTSYHHVQQADPGLLKISVDEVLHASLRLLAPGIAVDNG